MSAPAVPTLSVRGVGKRLTSDLIEARRQGVRDIRDEVLVRPPDEHRPLRKSEFWALRDIDFEVAPGEALGIIGFNGAGKSTLLRLLHGLTLPDAGTITIEGSHTAMLNLGAPFSRVLTGRENVVAAAALHGVVRRDLSALVAAVREFSELEASVLDAPMTTYSSGMQLRLGYGIAAQLPANLLLVDEVIAVGDIAFQRKCLAHIRSHLGAGGSAVLVSHDLWMIQALCSRCIVLDQGRIQVYGTPNRAISSYLRQTRPLHHHAPRQRLARSEAEERQDHARIEVTGVDVLGGSGGEGEQARNGVDVEVVMEASSHGGAMRATWRLDVLSANQQVCLASMRPEATQDEVLLDDSPQLIRWRIPDLPLLPGIFFLSPHLQDPDTGEEIGRPDAPYPLEVHSRDTRLDTLAQMPGAGALSSVTATYRRVT